MIEIVTIDELTKGDVILVDGPEENQLTMAAVQEVDGPFVVLKGGPDVLLDQIIRIGRNGDIPKVITIV